MAGSGRCDHQAAGVWGLAPMRSSGRLLGLDVSAASFLKTDTTLSINLPINSTELLQLRPPCRGVRPRWQGSLSRSELPNAFESSPGRVPTAQAGQDAERQRMMAAVAR